MENTLSQLLEELINEISTESNSTEELAKRLRNARKTLAKLLDVAPLLVIAANWNRGDCRKLISYTLMPKYEDDDKCLEELRRYLEANKQIIDKEFEEFGCQVFIPLFITPENKGIFREIALLFSSTSHYINIVLNSEKNTLEKHIIQRLVNTYLRLLIALRGLCI